MSDPRAEPAKQQTAQQKKFQEFWARHSKLPFTPAYNAFLEALIANKKVPLFARICAWALRRSWGNHSDWPVNAKGVLLTQSDCAAELGFVNAKGKPYRQKVNPVFQELERLNFQKFKGQEMTLIDDPMGIGFADSSPKADPYRTFSEEKENNGDFPSFQSFIAEIWAEKHPVEYKAYQETAQRYKEFRTGMLTEWNALKEEVSERGETNGKARPKGGGQPVREGGDTTSEREATNEEPHPYRGFKQENVNDSSSSVFSVVGEAFRTYASADDDGLTQLINGCRKNAPDCTPEEIAHFVHEKAKLITKRTTNPGGLLLMAVPKCFVGESFAAYRTRQQKAAAKEREQTDRLAAELRAEDLRHNSREWLEEQIEAQRAFLKENPRHGATASIKARIAEMEAKLESLRKAKGASA